MTPKPHRVVARFLESGAIGIPGSLLKEVTDWALSNWAVLKYHELFRSYELASNVVGDIKEKIDWGTRELRSIIDSVDNNDIDGAAKKYRKFQLNGESTLAPLRKYMRGLTHTADFYTLSKETLLENLHLMLDTFVDSLKPDLNLEAQFLEGLERKLQTVETLRGGRTTLIRDEVFVLEGDQTRYKPLHGKEWVFKAEFRNLPLGGTWDWKSKTLSISSNLPTKFSVVTVVRHELQHAVQNYLAESLGQGSDKPNRSVGVGPRKTLTPEFQQHGNPKSLGVDPIALHHLDDLEFHTELQDAKDRLIDWMKHDGPPRKVFDRFVQSDEFLAALRSTPRGAAKYRVALKELAKVLT